VIREKNALMERMRSGYKILSGNLKERGHSEDLGVNGSYRNSLEMCGLGSSSSGYGPVVAFGIHER
jgi:hypothetical protein